MKSKLYLEPWVRYHRLGTKYLHQHKLGLSEKYYKKAISAAEDKKLKHQLLNALGNVYFQERKYKKALDYYKNSLRYNNHKSVVLANIAFTYKELKNKKLTRLYTNKALLMISKESDFYRSQRLKKQLISKLNKLLRYS